MKYLNLWTICQKGISLPIVWHKYTLKGFLLRLQSDPRLFITKICLKHCCEQNKKVQGQVKTSQWGKTDIWKLVHTEIRLHSGKIAVSD
jgi:hypothetical protein